MYRTFGKRLFDLALGVPLALALVPVIAVIAILIRFKLGAPVFFSQERPGRNGKIFRMVKFRSMTDQRDEAGQLLPDEVRLTAFGQWLRSSSLDELPEIWNVLRGEMSLVGPRPLLVRYLPRYSPEQARRHDVRPGVTGWAQVNGRNAISWEQKFALDQEYVDHHSLVMDLRILFMTSLKVLRRDGVSAADHVTMPEFMGSPEAPRQAA